MSALAARRAAEAARKAEFQSASSQLSSATSAPKLSTTSSTLQLSSSSQPISSTPANEASLPSRVTPTPKRRKIDKVHPERQSNLISTPVADGEQKAERTRLNRATRFSPSIPVDEDDGPGSSGDDVNDDFEAGQEVSDSRRWSGYSTPDRGWTVQRHPEAKSSFISDPGSNFYIVDEETLRKCGIQEGSGPGALISLDKEDSIILAGIFNLTPLQGCIRVFSTFLESFPDGDLQSHTIFAPTSHPLPTISPAPSKYHGKRREFQLERFKLPSTFMSDSSRCIFVIRAYLSGLSKLQGEIVPGFSNIWPEGKGIWGLHGVHLVYESFPTPVYPYVEPATWTTALTAFQTSTKFEAEECGDQAVAEPAPIVLVKGPKRSGKSSFARATLNQLLQIYESVSWLETDLGQGEFGCGGVVALYIINKPVFGPSFTHPQIPDRAIYLGSSTPQTCPDEYIAAVRQLIDYYRYEVQYSTTFREPRMRRRNVIPLIVNTQGWVKGLGEELLQNIETLTQPTHIFAFEVPQVEEHSYGAGGGGAGWTSSPSWQTTDLPFGDNWSLGPEKPNAITFTLEAAPISPLQARYTPADLRVLSIMTYFHSILGPSSVDWDFSEPLLALSPWQVNLGDKLCEVYLTGEGSGAIISEDLPLSLNGSIIALHERLDHTSPSEIYEQSRPLPSLDEITFLGLALVRGLHVDGTTSPPTIQLQLLSPLPTEVLRRASVIVRNGAMELPTCGMLNWRNRVNEDGIVGWKWEDVPFLAAPGEMEVVGGERRRFRRNIMRKGQ